MKFFLHITLFALLLTLASAACKEKDPITPTPPVVGPTDPAQYETPFAEIPSTADMVLYEINERAFSNSGDFAGIVPRLDSIRALGVNVIWLMPIHPIGAIKTVNSPYCIANFKEANPEYGTLEDLRTLVREAHARKMAVILDWAANHTAWDNPWLASHKAWYTQDATGNVIHPENTNWEDVADLNFDSKDMRLEMIRSMKYWVLTANVDGFRCDAADFVPFDFWKQAIDSLKRVPNRNLVLLAEGARADHFTAGFQLNFAWGFFNKNVDIFKNNQPASGLFTTHQSEYDALPSGVQKMRFTSNHDKCAWEDTPLGFFGGKNGSISAFVATAFMGGVPLIYNGQEVGCAVKLPFFSRSPINWTTNPDMFKTYKSLMSIRAAHPALRSGDLKNYSSTDIVAFKRAKSPEEVLVFANTRNAAKAYNVPSDLLGTVWTDAVTGAPAMLPNTVNLGAFEYRILYK